MKLCFTKLICVTHLKILFGYIMCNLLGEQKDYVQYVQ